jgi:hypothetical protein
MHSSMKNSSYWENAARNSCANVPRSHVLREVKRIAASRNPTHYQSETITCAGHKLQLAGHKLQLAGHKLQLAGHKLQLAGHKLQLAGHKLQLAGHKLQLAGRAETTM